MALTGKSALSQRKQDLQNEKSIALGFQKLVFATKATGGESGIDLTALSAPSEMTVLGFVNPSAVSLAGANLKFNRRNFTLKSSLRGVLIDYLAFDVASSTRINFLGFTAEAGEIFVGTLDDNPKTNLLAVDAQPIVSTGVLAISATDFNVGTPFRVNQFPSAQVGSVLVFKDGVQQYRNVGNATAAPTADGNYQEVDPGGGLGVIIRFNIADVVNAHNILVFNPGLAERPDGSMMAVIEEIAGQLDQVIPTVAALAGVPETDFQAAPSNVDLKAFGDKVTQQGEELADHESRIDFLEDTVVMQAGLTAAYAVAAADPVIYDTIINDTHSGYSTVTGLYTVPKDGYYRVSSTTATTGTQTNLRVYKNGVGMFLLASGSNTFVAGSSATVKCLAGDTIAIHSDASTTMSGFSVGYSNFVCIERI